jgi:hypothetical protein
MSIIDNLFAGDAVWLSPVCPALLLPVNCVMSSSKGHL